MDGLLIALALRLIWPPKNVREEMAFLTQSFNQHLNVPPILVSQVSIGDTIVRKKTVRGPLGMLNTTSSR